MPVRFQMKFDFEGFGDFNEKILNGFEDALSKAGFLLHGTVRESISRGSKTGRVYQRGSVRHRASAPGQAPATDTGRLINSILKEERGPMEVAVGSGLLYAGFLEEGTATMDPRPYFKPALEKERNNIDQMIESTIQSAIS